MLNLPDKAADDAALDKGSIFFVGTATVILRYGGFTITDPNFLRKGEHAHLGYGLKTPRLTEPAMPFEKLPPIDLVLLSHYHGDHFDQVVEAKLDKNTPIVSTPHAVEQLRERAIPIHYNDYPVFKSPLGEFLEAAERAGLADKLNVLQHGETYRFSVAPERLD